ncbi:ferrous iron transport protein A [Candidatus Sumerlaeota bacterium]|nr:ferrous iron transport protein A [Candidatus Sumerlaeota bacterium]
MSRFRNRFRGGRRPSPDTESHPRSSHEDSPLAPGPHRPSSPPGEPRCRGPFETLFDLVTGDVARIVRVRGRRGGIRQRLMDMGITRGAVLRVERHAPLGDPVEVAVKGSYLALRMSEARFIDVERM